MKVLALYTHKTLPVLRRIIAPFSTLSTRGQRFEYRQVATFDLGPAYSYDVALLQNWVLSEEELDECRRYVEDGQKYLVYDLTDPELLLDIRVQRLLQLCHFVTVPNEFLKKELAGITRSVKVVPSTLDVPFFMTGRTARNALPKLPKGAKALPQALGCFGPHDWRVVYGAVARLRRDHPRVVVYGDAGAKEVLSELVTHPIEFGVEDYPALLLLTTLGLCPKEGYDGGDTLWAYEYGILQKPVVASAQSAYAQVMTDRHLSPGLTPIMRVENTTESWYEGITRILGNPLLASMLGNAAFYHANAQRNVCVADVYQKTYVSYLPHLH